MLYNVCQHDGVHTLCTQWIDNGSPVTGINVKDIIIFHGFIFNKILQKTVSMLVNDNDWRMVNY